MTETAAGVFYPNAPFVLLSGAEVERLSRKADSTPLGRARFCAHDSPGASVQEMLIVQTAASIVRPHRHRAKFESLLLLEGELEALFFDDAGVITERHRMRSYSDGGPFFYRIPPLTWHSIIVVTPRIVMQEVVAGPFRAQDTEFAAWAPDMNEASATAGAVADCGCPQPLAIAITHGSTYDLT